MKVYEEDQYLERRCLVEARKALASPSASTGHLGDTQFENFYNKGFVLFVKTKGLKFGKPEGTDPVQHPPCPGMVTQKEPDRLGITFQHCS